MRSLYRYLLGFIGLLAICCSYSVAQNTVFAQSTSSPSDNSSEKNSSVSKDAKPVNKTNKVKKPKVFLTPGRQTAAMTFAKLHHPELADLLTHLKQQNRAEYKHAIREIYQTSEQLARTRERWPERYQLNLEAWKLDSRIRLMLAHIMISKNDVELDGELEKLLLKRVDIQVQQLTVQRERLTQQLERVTRRVEKLDASISRIESDRKAAARKALLRIKRSLKARSKKKTRKSKSPSKQKTRSSLLKKWGRHLACHFSESGEPEFLLSLAGWKPAPLLYSHTCFFSTG